MGVVERHSVAAREKREWEGRAERESGWGGRKKKQERGKGTEAG